jgi:transglutaminase-like putative cysteine protease
MDVFNEKTGVCRDYQHLAVTLPGPWNTGAIRDRLPRRHPDAPGTGPMDFSAWYQVYLDNQWWDFDARHNKPFIGRR